MLETFYENEALNTKSIDKEEIITFQEKEEDLEAIQDFSK